MQDSYNSSKPSDSSTLEKLLEADSLLAAQEEDLVSRLEAIREKRQSLKIVLDIFEVSATSDSVSVEEVVGAPLNLQSPPSSKAASNSKSSSNAKVTQNPAGTAKGDSKSSAKIKASSKSNGSAVKKRKPAKSSQKETPQWQQYIKGEFDQDASLAQIVTGVLTDQPDRVFEISEMIATIFVDGMPSEANALARDRVSNILSMGARRKQWQRPKPGFYTMAGAKAKDDSAKDQAG